MTTKIGDISFKVGEYEKDGQTKGRWHRGGVLLKGDDGGYFGSFVGPWGECKFSVFQDRPKGESYAREAAAQAPADMGGDMPF